MREVKTSIENNFSIAKISFLEKLGIINPKCPICKSKMKKIEWPFELGFICPKIGCRHIIRWKKT